MQTQSSPSSFIAYTRVSTDGQEKDGAGLEAQRDSITAYATVHGLTIAAWHTDTISGTTSMGERPGLTAAYGEVATGTASGVIVYDLDRLFRSMLASEMFFADLARNGGTVIAVNGGAFDSDDPERILVRQMRSAFAEWERAKIRARMMAGKKVARRNGQHTDSRIAYGYQHGEKAGRFSIHPAAANIVKRIYTEAAEGATPAGIARSLTHDGIPTPSGGTEWSRVVVTRILRNPVYRGELHGIRDAQPAIVSIRLWNRAQPAPATA